MRREIRTGSGSDRVEYSSWAVFIKTGHEMGDREAETKK